MFRRGIGIIVAILILGHAGRAQAQDSSWLDQGRKALLAGDAVTARWAFGQGLGETRDLETRWRLLIGMALANEMEGSTLEAVYAYRRFLASVRREPVLADRAPWPGRRQRALSDVRRLEKDLLEDYSKMAIESTPSGAAVVLDGDATEHVTPAVVYVAAGKHQVRLELEGHEPATVPVEVVAGDQPLLQPDLVPLTPPVPPMPSTPDFVRTEVDLSPWMRFSGAISLALGGSLVVAAGALHASALRTADEITTLPPVPESVVRDDALRTRVSDYQTAFITCYAVGGAFLASGVGLLVADAMTEGPATTGFVAPQPGGATVGLAGHW